MPNGSVPPGAEQWRRGDANRGSVGPSRNIFPRERQQILLGPSQDIATRGIETVGKGTGKTTGVILLAWNVVVDSRT